MLFWRTVVLIDESLFVHISSDFAAVSNGKSLTFVPVYFLPQKLKKFGPINDGADDKWTKCDS